MMEMLFCLCCHKFLICCNTSLCENSCHITVTKHKYHPCAFAAAVHYIIRSLRVFFSAHFHCEMFCWLLACSANRTLGIASFTPKSEGDRITLETFCREMWVPSVLIQTRLTKIQLAIAILVMITDIIMHMLRITFSYELKSYWFWCCHQGTMWHLALFIVL